MDCKCTFKQHLLLNDLIQSSVFKEFYWDKNKTLLYSEDLQLASFAHKKTRRLKDKQNVKPEIQQN